MDATTLGTIKTQILANLADLLANPKPTYSVDGQSVSWESYQSMLMSQLKTVNELLQMETPYEIRSSVL